MSGCAQGYRTPAARGYRDRARKKPARESHPGGNTSHRNPSHAAWETFCSRRENPGRRKDADVEHSSSPRPFHPDCVRSEEHTSELQSHLNLVCRLLLEKKKKKNTCMQIL